MNILWVILGGFMLSLFGAAYSYSLYLSDGDLVHFAYVVFDLAASGLFMYFLKAHYRLSTQRANKEMEA